MASKEEVKDFLRIMKQLVTAEDWHLEPRNFETIALLGLTVNDIKDLLLELTVEDYCAGPFPDRDDKRPGDVWIFQILIFDTEIEIYVKPKLNPTLDHLTVLSFHPPSEPLDWPFR